MIFRFSTITLVLLCSLSRGLAQNFNTDPSDQNIPKPQSFTFKVYKDTGGPLGAKVGLANAHIRISTLTKSFKVRTDASGKKIIKHLPNAHYTIEISRQGCQTVQKKLKRTFATNHLTVGLKCNYTHQQKRKS